VGKKKGRFYRKPMRRGRIRGGRRRRSVDKRNDIVWTTEGGFFGKKFQ